MEPFATYVLYSEKYQKIYIGYSSSIIQRFYSHNFFSKKGFTTKYRPWKVIHLKFHSSKKEALKHEKALKSGKGRQHIHDIIIPQLIKLGFISA